MDALGDPLPPGVVARLGSVRWRYIGPTGDLQFSADGRFLVQSHDAFSFTVWHYPEGRAAFRFQFPVPATPDRLTDLGVERPPARVRFSPDSRTLFAFGGFGELYRVRLPDGSHTRLATIESHLLPAAVSNDGRRLVAEEPVTLPDGRLATHILVRGTTESRWRRIDTSFMANERALPQFDAAIAASPDGRFVAVANYSHPNQALIRTWDLETGTAWQMPCWNLAALQFSPDGRSLLGLGSHIWLWQIREWPGGKPELRLAGGFSIPQVWPVRADSAQFTPDGRRIVVGFQGGVQVRDVRDLRLLGECDVSGYEIEKIAVAADGRTIALAPSYEESVLGVIRFIDVATGRRVALAPGHTDTVENLHVSPDGRRLVSRSSRGDTFVWDATPRLVATSRSSPPVLRFAARPGHELQFPAPGVRVRLVTADRLLVWGSEEKEVGNAGSRWSMWGLDPGPPRRMASLGLASDHLLAVRPGGTELMACNENGRLSRYDLRSGNFIDVEFRPAPGAITLACSADGRQVHVGRRGEPDMIFDLT